MHWLAYERVKGLVAEYEAREGDFAAIELTLADWMTADDRKREKDVEFADRIARMKAGK